jgi:hypothetical protein
MAIYATRSYRPIPERRAELRPLLVELTRYVNDTYPDVKAEVITGFDGPVDSFYAVIRTESLAGFEEWMYEKWLNDEKGLEIVKRLREVLQPEAEWHFYRTVE